MKKSEDRSSEQLSALASYLVERRPAILEAWRRASDADPERSVASSLSRAQFNDHIPAVLDCLGHTIQDTPASEDAAADANRTQRVCDHGLQRWQQGYQLRELVREWGHLQLCVANELDNYAEKNPTLEPRVMRTARREWTQLCADGVTESATQYWRLHQSESAGHVNDLEMALTALHEVQRLRAEAWRDAAHDLRGSVTVVKGATTLLDGGSDSENTEVAQILRNSVSSLNDMLGDLLSLARLEAGHEQRELTTFDAATLLRDFCNSSQRIATDRGLTLEMSGPSSLPVQGDKNKLVRIVQNLLLNAVKYTERGGVSVTWGLDNGRDTDRWTFSVQDTGPGIDENRSAPLAQDLHAATEVADEASDAHADRRQSMVKAETLPSESKSLTTEQQPGEGVGLTIVKRLCELLDASLELATRPGHGTTFRVVLPRRYDS